MRIVYIKFLILIYCVSLSCSKSTTEKSSRNDSTQQIWHSYEFGTGVGNREEPDFSIVELKEYFILSDEVYKWKALKVNGEIVIVGLGKNFVGINTYGSNANTFESREDILEDTTDFIVFQKWDSISQSLKSYITVIAKTVGNNCSNFILKWYIIENKNLIFISNWSFYRQIIFLDSIKINNELKLFIISQQENSGKNTTGDIYSFNISPKLDIWLFAKISINFTPSSVSSFSDNENTFLVLSFTPTNTIHVWKYSRISCSRNEPHFDLHQNIYVINLKSFNIFQVGFRWYLIVACKQAFIYELKENLMFYPIRNLTVENVDNWFVVPIDNYREDKILVSTSEKGLAAAAWSGNGDALIFKNITQNLCKSEFDCERKMSEISLMNSTSFSFNGYQIILMPTESGTPLMMKLFFKLNQLPDVKVLKLNELLKAKKLLEKNYLNLNAKIGQLREDRSQLKQSTDRNGTFSKVEISQGQVENNENFKPVSSVRNWTDVYTIVEKLNAKIGSLVDDIQNFQSQRDRSSNSFKRSEEVTEHKTLSQGITFYGDVIIKNLNLTVLNGFNASDLLKNLYRKDKKKKIGGIKTLKNIKASHISFNKVKNISNCDIIFTNDYSESKSIDVNGDVIFENSLSILNDVEITHQGDTQVNPNKSTTMLLDIQKTFDMLQFEELSVTSETNILTSLNSQPLILPVHNAPLDIHYLNVANQARIEHVNVQSDLKVDSINGQNFNNLTNQILFKNITRKGGYKKARINGVLSVDSLAVKKIIGKPKNLGENKSNLGVKLPQTYSDSISNTDKRFSQSSQNIGRKQRKIHVYQNLEINGVIHTNKINQLEWSLLNDTIRKGSNAVISGKKKFKETVVMNTINVSGTINDVKPENFLNNFTEQIIQFPQTFNRVEFKNLTLKGTWDRLDLKNVNFSSIKPLEFKGNLSLDNCSLVTDVLEVTDFINNISLKNLSESKAKNLRVESVGSIKIINASKVTINSSLHTKEGINNINISSLSEKRVSKSTPQIIHRNFSLNNFKFNGAINIVNLNGKEVSNIIKPGGDVRIIEDFLKGGETNKIKQLLVKGEIKTKNGINGFDLSNLASNGIRIKESSTIDDSLVFEDVVFFDKLNIPGRVNNIDLRRLENDLVFQTEDVFLSGPKNFTKLRVMKSAKIRSLNGHFVEDIVTSEGYHIMKGAVQINGNVIVRGNVTSNGAINNINLPNFLRKYSSQYNSYVVSEDLYLPKKHVDVNNLLVGGKIQNTDFDGLMKRAIAKDESFNVVGNKRFTGEVTFKQNAFVENTINGLSAKELFSDIVMVDEPGKIEGTVTVEEAVLNIVDVKEYFNSSLINNIHMNDWFEESIPLNEGNFNVHGKMTFENPQAMENIQVDFINGQITSAMILLNEKQYIPIAISFQNVNVTSDVHVGGFVNGKDLMKEYEDSILVEGSQMIEGTSIFLEDFIVDGNLSVNSVKGKVVNDLITLDTPQTITNLLDFKGSVIANKGLRHIRIINNIDLIDWDNRSVLLNREQEINGFWEVKENIKSKDIKGEALMGSVSLFNVSNVIQMNKQKAFERKSETEIEYYDQCRRVEELSGKFTKQPYVFSQFEVSQIIETSSVIESVIPFRISNSEYLIITFANSCLSTLYKWDKENSTFNRVRQINIGPVSKWLVSYQNSTTYLVTSSFNSDVECEKDLLPGNVWTFAGSSDRYVHLYTTDSFIDAVQDNETSETFFTLEKGGAVYQWFIKSETNISFKFLISLEQENYKFVDKRIFNDLALSNGREIKVLRSVDEKIVVNTFFLLNNNIVPLPFGERILTAVVVRDKIVVYKNLKEEKIFSVIHTFRANSVLWFNYGFEKQAFLIVSSHHKLIEIYEYKGASGFVKRTSLPLFSARLQSVSLPLKNKFQLFKFVIVIHKKKILFLKAEMLGDFFDISDSIC